MATMRQMALVGTILATGCERAGPPTSSPASTPPSPSPSSASPEDALSHSHVRAKPGASLFDEPDGHAALFTDEVGLSYRILERQPHWVKVATIPWDGKISDSRVCMNRFRKSHEELELHVWIHAQDVATVVAERVSQEYGDGTTVTLAAGVRLEHDLPGEPWMAWLEYTRLPVPDLPSGSIARSFDPTESQKLAETAYPITEGDPPRYADGLATAEGRHGWQFSRGPKREIVAHAVRPIEGEVLAELRTYCGSVTVRLPESRVGAPVPRGSHSWPSYPMPSYDTAPEVPAGVDLTWFDERPAGKTVFPLHVDDLGWVSETRLCFRLSGVDSRLCYAPTAPGGSAP